MKIGRKLTEISMKTHALQQIESACVLNYYEVLSRLLKDYPDLQFGTRLLSRCIERGCYAEGASILIDDTRSDTSTCVKVALYQQHPAVAVMLLRNDRVEKTEELWRLAIYTAINHHNMKVKIEHV